ncbi:MAG: hypothetical protein KGL39_37615 [Patescibacteria group bacterium]|nr:hypothetical protein [Patescibacteria group bacterium]
MVDTTSVVTSQLSAGLLASWILERLKGAAWLPFVNKQTAPIFAGLASLVSAVGVHVSYQGGTLMVTGLTLTGIITIGWAWMKQQVFQEVMYRGLLKKPLASPEVAPAVAVETPKVAG